VGIHVQILALLWSLKEKADIVNTCKKKNSLSSTYSLRSFWPSWRRWVTPISKLRRKRRNWSTKRIKGNDLNVFNSSDLAALVGESSADFLGLHQRSSVHYGSQPWRMKREAHRRRRHSLSSETILLFVRHERYYYSGSRLEECEGRTIRLDSILNITASFRRPYRLLLAWNIDGPLRWNPE